MSPNEHSSDANNIDLDAILIEIDTSSSRYRYCTWTLHCAVLLLAAVPLLSYIFTASPLSYRCRVPWCDDAVARDKVGAAVFAPSWLPNAVPTTGSRTTDDVMFSKCTRFVSIAGAGVGDCLAGDFNHSQVERCTEFVFETDEVSIEREFNLMCTADGEWQLALIGTLDYAASCLMLPVCAGMSDKYGRRPILLANLVLGGISGIAKSYATTYTAFAAMEFITAAVSSGTFMTVLVLGIESSTPARRVFVGTLLSAVFSFSQVVCGALAAYVPHFRHLLRWLFVPNFVLLTFVWLVPESVRWLLAQKRHAEAAAILQRAAKINGRPLSARARKALATGGSSGSAAAADKRAGSEALLKTFDTMAKPRNATANAAAQHPFRAAMRSRVLVIRLLNCLFAWFATSFVYYGMNVTSVTLGGSKYVNFALVNLVELPAIFVAYTLMERIGRRRVLNVFLAAGSAACLATHFTATGAEHGFVGADAAVVLQLVLFVLGKGSVTLALTVLYVYTTEMFPTPTRQSFTNACSTVGAIGAMLAPLTPLLGAIWAPLPMWMFAAAALAAGVLALWLPETLGKPMPDTVDEAECLALKETRGSVGRD